MLITQLDLLNLFKLKLGDKIIMSHNWLYEPGFEGCKYEIIYENYNYFLKGLNINHKLPLTALIGLSFD